MNQMPHGLGRNTPPPISRQDALTMTAASWARQPVSAKKPDRFSTDVKRMQDQEMNAVLGNSETTRAELNAKLDQRLNSRGEVKTRGAHTPETDKLLKSIQVSMPEAYTQALEKRKELLRKREQPAVELQNEQGKIMIAHIDEQFKDQLSKSEESTPTNILYINKQTGLPFAEFKFGTDDFECAVFDQSGNQKAQLSGDEQVAIRKHFATLYA
jgi:hypothetical protein